MGSSTDALIDVEVYPVGVFLDLRTAMRWARGRRYRAAVRLAWHSLCRSLPPWRHRSAWNGYLAEPERVDLVGRCGHGWTRERARADLIKAISEARWWIHEPCGRARAASPDRRTLFCVECNDSSPLSQWTRGARL